MIVNDNEPYNHYMWFFNRKKNKRLYIVHGWGGQPDSNWFPWLKERVEKIGFEAEIPRMPDANNPSLQSWLMRLYDVIKAPDEDTYLVGHSLGSLTILRYLEAIPEKRKIGAAILVAGFCDPIEKLDELNNFFDTPLDYRKIISASNKIIAINSDNDPWVPLHFGESLKEKVGAELIVLPHAGHINSAYGFSELPIVYEKLKELSGGSN